MNVEEFGGPAVLFALIALAVLLGGGIMAWVTRRSLPQIGPVFPIIEESVDGLVLAPWSPTRGYYRFAVADLPAEYQRLQGVDKNEFVTQFAEDVDDARAMLLQHYLGKAVQEGVKIKTPPITAEPVNFRCLTKRKKDRHA